MRLQDQASSQHIVCLGCTMGFQGRRQKSLSGLADGGFEGAGSAIRDPLPCLNNEGGRWQSSLCRRHAGERGGGKREEQRPIYGIYSQSPRYNSLHRGNIQLPKQACSFTQFPLYFRGISGAFYRFAHKNHLWKPSDNAAWMQGL